jgi:uncharacterized protein YunC (DUF1805 family)
VSNSLSGIGFVTALEDPQHGFFGGYLVLSRLGRPLEFHCSTPVLPNPAQRILYGPTLNSYVLADLIGQALVAKSELEVPIILTDQRDMLGLALLREEFVAYVDSSDCVTLAVADREVPVLAIEGSRLHGAVGCGAFTLEQADQLRELASHVQLLEPFDRIREAIREAQRMTDPATETPDALAA